MQVAAAWLHDVGYAAEVRDTGLHQLDGARFLAACGVPSRVCALVARHAGAEAVAELVGLAGALAVFPDECSPVRDGLWYCDMTTGPDGRRMTFDERMAELRARRCADDPVVRLWRSTSVTVLGLSGAPSTACAAPDSPCPCDSPHRARQSTGRDRDNHQLVVINASGFGETVDRGIARTHSIRVSCPETAVNTDRGPWGPTVLWAGLPHTERRAHGDVGRQRLATWPVSRVLRVFLAWVRVPLSASCCHRPFWAGPRARAIHCES